MVLFNALCSYPVSYDIRSHTALHCRLPYIWNSILIVDEGICSTKVAAAASCMRQNLGADGQKNRWRSIKLFFVPLTERCFRKKNIDEVVHKYGLPLTVHKN